MPNPCPHPIAEACESPCCAEFGTSGCRCWEYDLMHGSKYELWEKKILPLVARLRDAQKEIAADNQIIAAYKRVLDACPECPVHGECVPHAVEWIEKVVVEWHALRSIVRDLKAAWEAKVKAEESGDEEASALANTNYFAALSKLLAMETGQNREPGAEREGL